jgi:hypothetical protein
VSAILSECERQRMFVRCSHPNVSTFSGIVSRTDAIFSANVRCAGAMFVRRRCDVLESLHVPVRWQSSLIVMQLRQATIATLHG